MRKIKVGQIGIAHNHGHAKMQTVQKFPELFEIIGYAESDPEWLKNRSGMDGYKDLPLMSEEEIIEKCDVILVECDIWNLTKTAQKCIDAGKHVHLDKPASGTLKEYEHLLNTAKAKGLTVQLGYMYRYNYAVSECMRMIRAGELGEIYQIDAEMSTYHEDEYRSWLAHFKGGTMYIFGSHLTDLIVSILGEPQKVTSFIKQTGLRGIYSDDNVTAVLEYEKAIAKITTLSAEVNGWGMRRFAVMGSYGTVEIKPIELDVHMTVATKNFVTHDYANEYKTVDIPDVPGDSRYDEMIKDLYLSVIGEKKNPYSYEHELKVQRTLTRIVGEN